MGEVQRLLATAIMAPGLVTILRLRHAYRSNCLFHSFF
jgi:hypothetical protein